MVIAESFAHVGVFATYFMSEYITANFGEHHDPLFQAIGRGDQGRQVNVLAPRGAAKSTIMAVIYPLHCIYFKWAYEKLDMKTNNFIIIVSKSHTMAKSRVQDIKRKIEVDTRFQHLKGEKWGESRLITSNDTLIVPIGRGGQIRGSLFGAERPDLIISDDLDDPETVNNPDVREKDQHWFDTSFLKAGRPDGTTNFINIDTVKHPESTANLLRDRPNWSTLFFQAIKHPADLWHPTAEHLWKQWEKIYTDLRLEQIERFEKSDAFYNENQTQMMAGVEHMWEEMIPYIDVRKEICNVGYFPVMKELQNSTHDASQTLFDMNNAVRFSIAKDGLLRSDNALIKWNEIAGVTIFLDWAGGKDLADNCYAACIAVAWVPLPGSRQDTTHSIMDGVHGYVIDAKIARVGPTEQVKMILDTIESVRTQIPKRDIRIRVGIEGFVQDTWQAQRQVIERDYIAEREKRQIRDCPSIEWLPRLRNKFDRIDALQPLIHNGWLCFRNELTNEFYKQMSLYPTGDFLDAPDALEGACELRISRFESERKARKEHINRQNKNFKVRL